MIPIVSAHITCRCPVYYASRIESRAGLTFSRKIFRERWRYILSHITLNHVYIHVTYKEEIVHEMRWPARRSNHPRPVCLLTAILGIVLALPSATDSKWQANRRIAIARDPRHKPSYVLRGVADMVAGRFARWTRVSHGTRKTFALVVFVSGSRSRRTNRVPWLVFMLH